MLSSQFGSRLYLFATTDSRYGGCRGPARFFFFFWRSILEPFPPFQPSPSILTNVRKFYDSFLGDPWRCLPFSATPPYVTPQTKQPTHPKTKSFATALRRLPDRTPHCSPPTCFSKVSGCNSHCSLPSPFLSRRSSTTFLDGIFPRSPQASARTKSPFPPWLLDGNFTFFLPKDPKRETRKTSLFLQLPPPSTFQIFLITPMCSISVRFIIAIISSRVHR